MSASADLGTCDFCKDPAVRDMVIAEPVLETLPNGGRVQKRPEVKAKVCASHRAKAVLNGDWREKQAERRRESREAMLRDQQTLL